MEGEENYNFMYDYVTSPTAAKRVNESTANKTL